MTKSNIEEKSKVYDSSKKFMKTPRTEESIKTLQKRLNRLIGQLNGIKKMVDENRYCGDILIQVLAVKKALESFQIEILKDHMSTCVSNEIKDGNNNIIDEVIEIVKKF